MAKKRSWETLKRMVQSMIEEDRTIGYLDPGIAGLLDDLNKIPLIATTSSCIGRITVIAGPRPWSRTVSLIVYKTHTRPTRGRISRVTTRGFKDLWIKATGPILHARTPSQDCASHMLEAFRPHGFKHSGVISLDPRRGYTVEVISGIDITAPLRMGGKDLIAPHIVEDLAQRLYDYIEEARAGFREAVKELVVNPGPCAG
ncbi:MAG: hypothetical protein F7B18_07185 [Desulfurococcales archaeon]|nr:hypothetical protein [Desulfurococcales archaeon]